MEQVNETFWCVHVCVCVCERERERARQIVGAYCVGKMGN